MQWRAFFSNDGTAIRALIRTAIALATAFGLKWDAGQVAAFQTFIEALLQLGVQAAKRY